MVLTKEKTKIESSTAASKFKVNVDGKLFSILSSKIYARPTESMVRELMVNAYDAHVAAGRADDRFDVSLSYDEPIASNIFVVRDYGDGLSPKDINNIYCVYGTSTKSDTNDLVGCWGLGSKSPFAVTDTFYVTSYHKGNVYYYMCQMTPDGPELHELGHTSTSEPSGVEIKVPISSNVKQVICSCFGDIFRAFNPAPRVTGELLDIVKDMLTVADLKHLDLGAFKLYAFETSSTIGNRLSTANFKLKMGPVIYGNLGCFSSDNCLVVNKLLSEARSYFGDFPEDVDFYSGLSGILEVPIGSIDVSASREDIVMSEHTKNTLLEGLKAILTYTYKEMRALYDSDLPALDRYAKRKTAASIPFTVTVFRDDNIELKPSMCNAINNSQRVLTYLHADNVLQALAVYNHSKSLYKKKPVVVIEYDECDMVPRREPLSVNKFRTRFTENKDEAGLMSVLTTSSTTKDTLIALGARCVNDEWEKFASDPDNRKMLNRDKGIPARYRKVINRRVYTKNTPVPETVIGLNYCTIHRPDYSVYTGKVILKSDIRKERVLGAGEDCIIYLIPCVEQSGKKYSYDIRHDLEVDQSAVSTKIIEMLKTLDNAYVDELGMYSVWKKITKKSRCLFAVANVKEIKDLQVRYKHRVSHINDFPNILEFSNDTLTNAIHTCQHLFDRLDLGTALSYRREKLFSLDDLEYALKIPKVLRSFFDNRAATVDIEKDAHYYLALHLIGRCDDIKDKAFKLAGYKSYGTLVQSYEKYVKDLEEMYPMITHYDGTTLKEYMWYIDAVKREQRKAKKENKDERQG